MSLKDRKRIIDRLVAARQRGLIGTVWVEDLFVRIHPGSPYEHWREDARLFRWDRVERYLGSIGA